MTRLYRDMEYGEGGSPNRLPGVEDKYIIPSSPRIIKENEDGEPFDWEKHLEYLKVGIAGIAAFCVIVIILYLIFMLVMKIPVFFTTLGVFLILAYFFGRAIKNW